MKRVAVFAFVAGMALIIGSCVPVAQSLWRRAVIDADEVLQLPPGTKTLTVNEIRAHNTLAVGLEFTLQGSANDVHWSLPYSVVLGDSNGRVIHDRNGVLGPADPETVVGRAGSTVRMRKRLAPMALDSAAELHLLVTLDDGDGEPKLSRTVTLFHDPPGFAIGFFATFLIWILGLLLVLTGAIQSIRDLAAVPARPGVDDTSGRAWGTACHLLALAGYLLPMGHLLAPLWLWRAKRDRHREVEIEGRESLNFQISVTVYALVALLLSFIFVGLVMLGAIIAFHFSMTLFAARRVQRGEPASYPLTLRIIPASAPGSQ